MNLFQRKQKSLLKKTYSPEGARFAFLGENPPVFPLNKNSSEKLSELLIEASTWAALDTLWGGNLIVQEGDNSLVVPYAAYDTLDSEEDRDTFHALGLPIPESLDVEARSVSDVGDQQFRILIEAHHPKHGPLRDGEHPRYGSVFLLDEETIVPLTTEQRRLFDVAKGEDVAWDSLEERMGYLAETKEAALKASAKIDGYLTNEDYQFRSEAELDLREESPDEVTLIPRVESMEEYGVDAGEMLLQERPPAVISKAVSPAKRKRMVLDKKLRKKLSELPPKGKVTGGDVPRLLTNPEQIVPEGFNLSLFSERVKGIKTRVYNSRPYIHVRRSPGGWFEGIPGIELDDWSPGEESPQRGTSDGLTGLSPETYQELLERAKKTGEEYVKHGDVWIRIDSGTGDKFEKTLDGLQREDDGTYKIPAGSMLEIYENLDLLEFVDRQSLSEDDVQLPDDLPDIPVPPGFNGELYPYQLAGYRWLSRLSKSLIGGLLADEMGLGKTVQAIAHFMRLKDEGNGAPHLVVVPKTLLDNWDREIGAFSNGALSVYTYDGPGRVFNPGLFDQFDVVLTTYDTLRRDQAKLGTVDWNMVVCDEAQYVKNPTALRTSAVKAMKSRHRAALTGTPVENGLIEFWCIMDFVQPGLLGSWSNFRSEYEHPIVEGSEEEREKRVQALLAEIRGYYLRRLKSDYLKELPPKQTDFREVPLSSQQFEMYQEIARKGKSGGTGAALGAIPRLLILSAHPLALDNRYRVAGAAEKMSCPKLEATLGIIKDIEISAEKVVIFTDYKAVQRILQDSIRKTFGIWPDIINGEITSNRQQILDIFSEKEGFNAIILGHQVGGIGLNIQAANHVIHYTRPWNPAKENQATDRCHRIGQTRPVTVYYPIVKDSGFVTVEERLDELIRSKEDLARDVLRPSSEFEVRREDLLDCLDMSKRESQSSSFKAERNGGNHE